MTKTILISVAVIVILGLLGVFFFYGKCHRGSYGHHGHHSSEWVDKKVDYINSKITKKLDLNESQQKELATITSTLATRMKAVHAKRKDWRNLFIDEFKKDAINKSAINKTSKDIDSEIYETRKALTTAYSDFHKMLTPEQRDKVVKKLEKHRKRYK